MLLITANLICMFRVSDHYFLEWNFSLKLYRAYLVNKPLPAAGISAERLSEK